MPNFSLRSRAPATWFPWECKRVSGRINNRLAGPAWATILGLLVGTGSAAGGEDAVPEWRVAAAQGHAARLEADPADPAVFRVVIEKLSDGNMPWHVSLTRKGFSLEANRSYILTFRGRAAETRGAAVSVGESHPPWKTHGLYRELELGPQWRLFRFRFICSATDADAQVQFQLGKSAAEVSLADIALEPAEPPGFQLDLADWKLSAAEGAKGEFFVEPATPKLFHIVPGKEKATKEAWQLSLSHGGLSFDGGQEYRLSFKARAPSKRPLVCVVLQGHPPWTNLGLTRPYELDSDWRLFRARFKVAESEPDGMLRFDVGGSTVDVEISDISLGPLTPEEGAVAEPADWNLTVQPPCTANLVVAADRPDVTRVVIGKTEDVLMPWHIRVTRRGLKVQAGEKYTLSFRARADEPRGIVCSINQGQSPWRNLGLYKLFTLTPTWETFQAGFRPDASEENAQIEISLGNSDVDVELAEVRLETVETVAPTPNRGRSNRVTMIGIGLWLIIGAIVIVVRSRKKNKAAPAAA